MKPIVKSLWWKLALAGVGIILVGSVVATLAIGPFFDLMAFRDMVRPERLKDEVRRERALLGGRLGDAQLARSLLEAMQDRLHDIEGSATSYGLAYSATPRISLAAYDADGSAIARIDAPGLPTPQTWLPSAERLQTVSASEGLLVLPLQPEGTLLVRHYAEFSFRKNLSSALRDTGEAFWLLVAIISIPGLLLGVTLTYWLSRRLGAMTRASQAWSRGDFSTRIGDRATDELGSHAAALDAMAGRIEDMLRAEQELAALKERQRLARELHDSVKQQVFATGLQLHAAAQWLRKEPDKAAALLERATTINQTVYRDLTEMLLRLRPVASERPLAALVDETLAAWTGQIGWRLELDAVPALSAPQQHQLLRIVAEAAANAVRHAGARELRVAAQAADGMLEVRIEDDGRGFDPGNTRPGQGLQSMSERAQALPRGSLAVHSGPQGTVVCLRFRPDTGKEDE